MAFKPGHEKLGGRKAGTSNSTTCSIRRLLNENLSEEDMLAMWKHFLKHRNQELRFSAFKLACFYMYGRPAKAPINAEDQEQQQGTGPEFDLAQIRTRHVPVQ
ncbi:MAG: hypothetical protein HRJ53_19320 [Acidobacteria bacterium Pan2503]|uniref:Uncharacterized protein n=1 Tax=Candidatus Acidiferrum panamense TaxID=2741543 RepID=A0A7V8NTE2_9BACT|nr:hypothetical protein [Candidatus Acidoferrum panamensis]